MPEQNLEFSRIGLYKNVKSIVSNKDYPIKTHSEYDTFNNLLDLSIALWDRLESPESESEPESPKPKELLISDEIETIWKDNFNKAEKSKLTGVESIQTNIEKEISKKKIKPKNKSEILRIIEKEITKFNNSNLFKETSNIKNSDDWGNIKGEQVDKSNQVFLSHSYDDRLYTTCLYEYFQSKNVFLYIDWMKQGKIEIGRELRKGLAGELENSEQIIFLPHINDQFGLIGKGHIKPWCAWELGVFYERGTEYINNQFYIDVYGTTYKNQHLDGLKKANKIIDGKIVE
jgi:hypothetical protein